MSSTLASHLDSNTYYIDCTFGHLRMIFLKKEPIEEMNNLEFDLSPESPNVGLS